MTTEESRHDNRRGRSLFEMSNEGFPIVMSSGRRHLFVGVGRLAQGWWEGGDFSQGSK